MSPRAKKRNKPRRRVAGGPPSVRIPLPKKTAKRHNDGKRYDRRRERPRGIPDDWDA